MIPSGNKRLSPIGAWAWLQVLLLTGLLATGCDQEAVLDRNVPIAEPGWSYGFMPEFELEIDDTTARYSLQLNLRHTGDYKYSNLFILMHTINPAQDTLSNRFEFTLAAPDGRWLGDGAGHIYSYRIPFSDSTYFPVPGTYRILLEQNMRDPVLPAIEDVGLRIEKR